MSSASKPKHGTINFTEKTFPSVRVAYVRHVGSYFECKPAWDALMKWFKLQNANFSNSIFFGIGYDNPDVVQNCRYDACISLPDNFPETPNNEMVKFQTIPSYECSTATHKGPYDNLYNFYKEIFDGESSSKINPCHDKPCMEIYLNSPEDTAPEDLLTEVYIPIK